MKNYLFLASILALMAQGVGQAQSAGLDYNEFDFDRRDREISEAVDNCIGDQYSTAAIANCANEEFNAWDKELNRVYRLLLNRLDAEGQASLKTAQRAWIVYRDAEYKTIDRIISTKIGTMYVLVDISKRTNLTKHRTDELTSHLFTLAN